MSTRDCEYYTVGWICAIDTEYIVACELLDEEYEAGRVPTIDNTRDPNIYTFGRIHHHNVVVACLPKGRYGVSSAAIVAERMRTTFTALRFGLMVGIAGGAPSSSQDIRLGDIVVSSPTPKHGGVIQYDFGKAIQDHEFDETGHLAPPPETLLHALSHMSMQHKRKGHRVAETLSAMIEKNPRLKDYGPSSERIDRLYLSSYIHIEGGECECLQSDADGNSDLTSSPNLIHRKARQPDIGLPVVHYGLIASANRLMKNALVRDVLSSKHDVLCFEMEAAGLMHSFPGIVIRGICDYSDTHKNDSWQSYAAASAAAYAKELLGIIPAMTPSETPSNTNPAKRRSRMALRRVQRACDQCRRRKIRCSVDRPCCLQCKTTGIECSYSQQEIKYGVGGAQRYCQACKLADSKCDMARPSCSRCREILIPCEYGYPAIVQSTSRGRDDLNKPMENKPDKQDFDAQISNEIDGGQKSRQARPKTCQRTNMQTGQPCGAMFDTLQDLMVHRRQQHGYKCQFCAEEKTFNREDELSWHVRLAHSGSVAAPSWPNTSTYSSTPSQFDPSGQNSPTMAVSRSGSPTSYVETSTEVFEYNADGRVTKRTYSRTASRSPEAGSTFDMDRRPVNESDTFLSYEQAQAQGIHIPYGSSYTMSAPGQSQPSSINAVSVDCEADFIFLEQFGSTMGPDERSTYLARLNSIRMKMRSVTTELQKREDMITDLTFRNLTLGG